MQMWWFAQLLYLDVCLKLPIVKQCVAFMVRVWLSPKKEKIKLKIRVPCQRPVPRCTLGNLRLHLLQGCCGGNGRHITKASDRKPLSDT